MTSMPTPDAVTLEAPLDPHLQARLDASGLATVLEEAGRAGRERVAVHLDDPGATASRATYAAWLRRQVSAWATLRLPAVPVASLDWPLASVRPQSLDVVGLLIADLREISPRMRPTVVPAQATSTEPPQPGIIVGAVALCVALAAAPARLLPSAEALTAGTTRMGASTRYLTRCADLAERAPGLHRELDGWSRTAGPVQTQLAVLTVQRLADRLADGLDARACTGW